jgi:hypothetical protein
MAVVCIAGTLVSVPSAAQERGGRRVGGAPASSVVGSTDSMIGPPIAGAPFSAESVTVVTHTLADGTRIEQRATARLYRDTAGRVRREQTIIGLDALTPAEPERELITLDSVPADPTPFVIDPVARTARRVPRRSFAPATDRLVSYFGTSPTGLTTLSARERRAVDAAGGGAAGAPDSVAVAQYLAVLMKTLEGLELRLSPAHPDVMRARNRVLQLQQELSMLRERERELSVNDRAPNLNQMAPWQRQAPIPPDVRAIEVQLGTRRIEGLKAIGRRTTAVIPVNRVGNDQPITITDERWESPELRLVVSSRFSDPRTGVVEYRLTRIDRGEPRADLFTVPADYTIIAAPGVRTVVPVQGEERGQRNGAPQ